MKLFSLLFALLLMSCGAPEAKRVTFAWHLNETRWIDKSCVFNFIGHLFVGECDEEVGPGAAVTMENDGYFVNDILTILYRLNSDDHEGKRVDDLLIKLVKEPGDVDRNN